MKFRNYCIVVMGKVDGAKLEIGKIADGSPRFLEAKGMVISTFVSVAEPGELTDYFKSLNRNFMLFDTDTSTSGYNLTNEKLHDALFGGMMSDNDFELEEMSNKLIDEIKKSSDVKPISGNTKPGVNIIDLDDLRKKEVSNMNQLEKEEVLNQILDKGAENLTDLDKEILDIIYKKG